MIVLLGRRMFAEKNYPEIMLPEELDHYLSRGWYRMGQTIFTTHFLSFGDQFYSAIWIRLDLEDYTFRKSLRKIIRQNNKIFTSKVRRASINPEKEALYKIYKASFPGVLAPSLKDSLLDGEDFNVFNTLEIAIYHDGNLVALSFFDIGRESAASIIGIYDPSYNKYSLGFYTMLLEMQFCLETKKRYYYPGYVVPGYARFDYKLRIGDVSYLDLQTQSWLPIEKLSPDQVPINFMEHKLAEIKQVLQQNNIPCQLLNYPLFEANLFGFWKAPYFDFPIFLLCYPQATTPDHLVIVYDVRDSVYQLIRCTPFDDLQFYFNESYAKNFDRNRFFIELIVVERILASSPEIAAITKTINSLNGQ